MAVSSPGMVAHLRARCWLSMEAGRAANDSLFPRARGWGSAVPAPRALLLECRGQICPLCLSLGLFHGAEM